MQNISLQTAKLLQIFEFSWRKTFLHCFKNFEIEGTALQAWYRGFNRNLFPSSLFPQVLMVMIYHLDLVPAANTELEPFHEHGSFALFSRPVSLLRPQTQYYPSC